MMARCKPLRQQRSVGAALVLVLWLMAALSLTVMAAAHGVRQQTQHVGLALERLRVESVLDGALQLTAQRLLKEQNEPSRYRRERLTLGEHTLWIEITPSNGLVDINVANDALISALLQRVGGVSPGEAMILAARIRDFVDPDDTPSGAGGAEAPQYRAAGWPSVPRNSALDDLSELKAVLGMTAELYDIILPHLSINGQQRIEIDSAPPSLIDALSGQKGLGAQIHNAPPENRAGMLLSGAASEYFSPVAAGMAQAVRVRTYIQVEGDRWWSREAWIDPHERPDTLAPWTLLSLEPTRRTKKPEQEWNP